MKGLASGVVAITDGSNHTCALTSGGTVRCWGSNLTGQLGNDAVTGSTVPSAVRGLASGVTAISSFPDTTCATTDDGRVACWGDNMSGNLGTTSPCISSSVPVEVPVESGVAVANEPFVVPAGRSSMRQDARMSCCAST